MWGKAVVGEGDFLCLLCKKMEIYVGKLRKPGAGSSRALFLEKEKHNKAARSRFLPTYMQQLYNTLNVVECQ